MKRVAVIGVGNPFRGDDGAGVAAAEALAGRVPAEVTVVDGEPTRLLDAWDGYDLVIVIDAMHGGAAQAGEILRISNPESFTAAATPVSSHGGGIAEAVALGGALGRLPPRLVVYAIEGSDFAEGEGLTPAVSAAVDRVAQRVAAEIGAEVDA